MQLGPFCLHHLRRVLYILYMLYPLDYIEAMFLYFLLLSSHYPDSNGQGGSWSSI